MKGWVGLVGWLYSGWFTHINGHNRLQVERGRDMESSPVKDQPARATQPTIASTTTQPCRWPVFWCCPLQIRLVQHCLILTDQSQQRQFFSMSRTVHHGWSLAFCHNSTSWRWRKCTGCPSSSASSTRCALMHILHSAHWPVPIMSGGYRGADSRHYSVTVALAYVRAAHNDTSSN